MARKKPKGKGKRPSYQWYPGDFRRDTAVSSLPLIVRGFWRELLDLMHDGEPYGHLTAGGDAIAPADLARMVGESREDVVSWLDILERRNVFSRSSEGVIYSRRMVRDDIVLRARIKGGKGAPQPNAKGGWKGSAAGSTEGIPEGGAKGGETIPSDPPPAVCSLQSASAEVHTHGLAPIASGPHRSHASCGRVCVPAFLHDEFKRGLGGSDADADATLRAWYADTLDRLDLNTPVADPLRFWRERFVARFGTPAPARVTVAIRKQAEHIRRTAWGRCKHDPRCGGYAECVDAIARELAGQPEEQPA